MKYRIDELTHLAFVHAESEVESLIDAYGNDKEYVNEYSDLLDQLRRYRKKRWGKTKFEVVTENAKSVPVMEVAMGMHSK